MRHSWLVLTALLGLGLGLWPSVAAAVDYTKELGVPDDGLFRPSRDLPGVEEAYLPPLFASSHAANLLLLKSGDLLCTWFTGTYEGLSDGAIAIARLPRNASQWSRPTVVDHRKGESFQNPVLFEAPDGTVWLFHTTQPAGQGQSHARILVTLSNDGARTWSAPHPLFAEPGAFVRHPPIVMPDGRWLLPMYFTPKLGATFTGGWGGADKDHSTIKISGDGGVHWSDHPVPDSAGLVQPEVLRRQRGDYVAFFRSRFADFIYRADSADGATWTRPRPTRLPNDNSSFQMTKLSDGEWVLAFNNAAARTGVHKPQTAARWPLSVSRSEDEGRTWDRVRDLETGERYPRSNAPDLPQPDRVGRKEYSYPSIQSEGRKIYVAYTYLRFTIKVVRFDEAWIDGGSTSGVFRGDRSLPSFFRER